MSEVPVLIPVEDGKLNLEGLFREGTIGRNALICHPLPLYGGNMANNVVVAAQRAFAQCGWSTLRFNFRGVGASGGKPGGEARDAEDLVAVSEFVKSNHAGALDLAGYSYGAWTALAAIRSGLTPASLTLFSPPLDFMSFEGLELPDVPTLITIGNQDEFCAVESLRKWLAGQSRAAGRVRLEIIPYCDHFYWEFGAEITSKLTDFLGKNFPGKPV